MTTLRARFVAGCLAVAACAGLLLSVFPQRATAAPVDMTAPAVEMTLIWQRDYLRHGGVGVRDGSLLPDGGFALVGRGRTGGWVARLDASGRLLWERGDVENILESVDGTPDGGVIVGGATYDSWLVLMPAEAGDYDMYVAKLDANGNMVWDRELERGGNESVSRVIANGDQGAFVFGALGRWPWGSGEPVPTLMSLGPEGETLWYTKLADTPGGDFIPLSDGRGFLAVVVENRTTEDLPAEYEVDLQLLTVEPSGAKAQAGHLRSLRTEFPHKPRGFARIAAAPRGYYVVTGSASVYKGGVPMEAALLSHDGRVLWRTLLAGTLISPLSDSVCVTRIATLKSGDLLAVCPEEDRISLFRLAERDGSVERYEVDLPVCHAESWLVLPLVNKTGQIFLASSTVSNRKHSGCAWLGRVDLSKTTLPPSGSFQR